MKGIFIWKGKGKGSVYKKEKGVPWLGKMERGGEGNIYQKLHSAFAKDISPV